MTVNEYYDLHSWQIYQPYDEKIVKIFRDGEHFATVEVSKKKLNADELLKILHRYQMI